MKMGSKARTAALAAVAGMLAIGSAAQAASLGLVKGSPDVDSPRLTGTYSGGVLSLSSSSAQALDVPAGFVIMPGGFTLSAHIDSSGNLVADPGNVFTITGNLVDTTGPSLVDSGMALTGTLTKFGFAGDSTNGFDLEFTFDNASGYLLSHGFGTDGGIIASGQSGTFTGDFTSTFGVAGVADTFAAAVPLPAALPAGFALMGATLLGRRRSRNQAQA